jgi:hypothetical protein
VDHGKPAGVATGSISQVTRDVPAAFTSSLPQRREALHEPVRRVDLEVLALGDVATPAGAL